MEAEKKEEGQEKPKNWLKKAEKRDLIDKPMRKIAIEKSPNL